VFHLEYGYKDDEIAESASRTAKIAYPIIFIKFKHSFSTTQDKRRFSLSTAALSSLSPTLG